MKATDRAWAAGILEGEGAVRINSQTSRNTCHLMVSITSTDREMVDWFGDHYGGTVRPTTTRPECKPAWRWTIAAGQAAAFLRDVVVYCRVPRIIEKIDLALWFQDQKSTDQRVNRSEEYHRWQEGFHAEMARLNQRGAAA